MAVYRAPGVYVVEDQTTPMPLTGVPTGIPCFFGFTQQGPSFAPTRITSMNEFYAIFGRKVENEAVFRHSYMADTVYGFFLNGGSECYVCRVNSGRAVTWPVKWIEGVVDYKKIADPYDPSTPEAPARASLVVKALSGGTWANKLLVKLRKAETEGALPAIETKVVVKEPPARAAYQNVRLGEDKEKSTGNWDKETGAFKMDKPQTSSATGKLTLTIDPENPIEIDVKFSPDTRLPSDKVTKAEFEEGQSDAFSPDEMKKWTSKTRVRFENVEDKDTNEKKTLMGMWEPREDPEEGGPVGDFYMTDKNGVQFVLCEKTVGTGPIEGGVLQHPLQLEPGLSLSFDLDVVEPVPPLNPGDPTGYRVLESYTGLSTNPNDPSYFLAESLVNGVSNYIVLSELDEAVSGSHVAFGEALPPGGDDKADERFSLEDPGAFAVNPGTDEVPPPTAYGDYFGLLKQVPDVSLIACPDAFVNGRTTPAFLYQPIFQAGIAYCEENRGMIVIDCPPQAPAEELGDLGKRSKALETFADRFRSTHAAIYSPWLKIPNLDPTADSRVKEVPPSGFMLGAYNRSDDSVGVWKAPANIPVLGPVGLQLPFTEEESEVLNPAGVNLIRSFPGYGILIWGARCTTKKVMWQYVNVRRLFLYVERTLKQQTMWSVFEPNDQKTWNKLVDAGETFLRGLWLAGGLMGSSPEEAFRVRCGVPDTMTMTDVDTGLLKVEVSIAPVRPAEFVVFTVSQLVQTPQAA